MGTRQATRLFGVIALIAPLVLSSPAGAIRTPDSPIAESLSDPQREALATLALADAAARNAILETSLHPGVLDDIVQVRQRSSHDFRLRLDEVPRSKQKDLWELVRYPELVDELVREGRPSTRVTADIVEPYPERVHELAQRLVASDWELLDDVARIRKDAEHDTAAVLAPLSLDEQASFETLIERPDLLSAMVNQPLVVERLARLYRGDPERARAVFDRHHEAQVAVNTREVERWRETLEDDPEAREELIESAERFAKDEGYDSPGNTTVETTEVHHEYHHPYPWWFGPPHWRIGWHWYPHHSHWGFQVSLAGGLYVHGLPSPVFSYWHYRRPRHLRHYRHLHRHWARYGRGHHLHRSYEYRHHRGVGRSHPSRRRHALQGPTPRHRDRRGKFSGHDSILRKRRNKPEAGPQARRRPARNGSRNGSQIGERKRGAKHERTLTRHVSKTKKQTNEFAKAVKRAKNKAPKAKTTRKHRSGRGRSKWVGRR